jgi:hypothetical protein
VPAVFGRSDMILFKLRRNWTSRRDLTRVSFRDFLAVPSLGVPRDSGPERTAGGAPWRRGGATKLRRGPRKSTMIEERFGDLRSCGRRGRRPAPNWIAKYSDLEGRMAEFEERLRCDPQCFAPLPCETAVLPRRLSRENRRNWTHFGPPWPTGKSGHREQAKSWRTGFYGDGTRDRKRTGRFFDREPMAHRREK